MRLASVRRSLFTNDAARSKFLAHLMTGTKEILQTGQGGGGSSPCSPPLNVDCTLVLLNRNQYVLCA